MAAPPGMWSFSLWMLLAMRRRASSRPSLCGRSTWIGCCIGRLWAAVRRFSRRAARSALLKPGAAIMVAAWTGSPLCRSPPPRSRRRCRAAAARARRPPTSPPGRTSPAIATGTWRRPAHAYRGHQLQPLSRHLRGRRDRPDLAAAAHRHRVGALRRPAVRDAAGDRVAQRRPDAALHPRLRDPGGRAGRAGVGLSQSGSERLRRRRAGKRPQALFGDRHGAAAADHARGV